MNKDNIIRAYTRLVGLKNYLPEGGWGIKENYVNDYHQIVDILSRETEVSLNEFKIPEAEVKKRWMSYSPGKGNSYSDERYYERELFLSKIDAILQYFQIVYVSESEEKETIGFQAPDKQ